MRTLKVANQDEGSDDSGVWLSVGDLMSVLLMIFALLLVAALVQISQVEEQSHNNRILIIKGMQDALAAHNLDMKFDAETGDISLSEKLFFDRNDAGLSARGQKLLRQFIPIYTDVIFQSPETENEVVRIVIEGHASSDGDFNHNMKLSVLRANSVSEFIQGMNFAHKVPFVNKLMISGRGPLDADQEQSNASDRNVKFRFQFKGNEFTGSLLDVKAVE